MGATAAGLVARSAAGGRKRERRGRVGSRDLAVARLRPRAVPAGRAAGAGGGGRGGQAVARRQEGRGEARAVGGRGGVRGRSTSSARAAAMARSSWGSAPRA